MRPPIFVRPLTRDEQQALTSALRSSDAVVVRRAQILLASARGERAPQIAHHLGCNDQTVRNVLQAFNAQGLAALPRGSSRPKTLALAFAPPTAERLRALLHQTPRTFGKESSLWTLDLAVEVSFEQGLTAHRVSRETIRATLRRLGVSWTRAKHWITSPDPAYAQKNGSETA